MRPLAIIGSLKSLPGRLRDIGGVLRHALRRFWQGNDLQAAGSLTYTTLLALVPLLTVTFAIFSAFPAYSRLRQQAYELLFDNLVPAVGGEVQSYVDQFMSNAAALTGFGVVGLAVTSIILFFSVEAVFNAIWRATDPRPLVVRILSFWAVLTVTPLLLGASLSVSSRALAEFRASDDATFGLLNLLLPGLFEAAAFTLMYLSIPNRDVHWKDAILGGVTAALLMEVSKIGFGLYITAFPTYETIYGALSAVPIFLLWLYTVWSIVLFGAEITAALPEWRAGKIVDVGPEGLLSAQRIVIALAILKELREASKLGVGMRRDTLAHRIPVGAVVIDGMLEQLRGAHWVERTQRSAWVLTRDLHDQTVDDLRHALGMGLRGNLRAVGKLQTVWQDHLAELYARAEAAGRSILGLPLVDLFDNAAAPPPREVQPQRIRQ